MNAANVLSLSRWVERNRQAVISDNLPMAALARKAADELTFKVPVNAMRDVLQSHGIATRRRAETTVRIESLEAERNKYRDWLLRSIDAGAIKTWLLEEMQKAFADDAKLSVALRSKLKTESALA